MNRETISQMLAGICRYFHSISPNKETEHHRKHADFLFSFITRKFFSGPDCPYVNMLVQFTRRGSAPAQVSCRLTSKPILHAGGACSGHFMFSMHHQRYSCPVGGLRHALIYQEKKTDCGKAIQ